MHLHYITNTVPDMKCRTIYILLAFCVFNYVATVENHIESIDLPSEVDEHVDEYSKIENFEIYKSNEEQTLRIQNNRDINLVCDTNVIYVSYI